MKFDEKDYVRLTNIKAGDPILPGDGYLRDGEFGEFVEFSKCTVYNGADEYAIKNGKSHYYRKKKTVSHDEILNSTMLKIADLVPGEEVEINWNCTFTKHPPFRFVRIGDYNNDGIFVNSKGEEDVFNAWWIKRLPPESLPLEIQIALKEKELAVLREKQHEEDWIEEGEILIGVRNDRYHNHNNVISNDTNEITVFRAGDSVSLSELKSLFYKSLRRATPTEIASFEAFEQELKK